MGDGRGEAKAAMRDVGYGDSDWAYDFLEQKTPPTREWVGQHHYQGSTSNYENCSTRLSRAIQENVLIQVKVCRPDTISRTTD